MSNLQLLLVCAVLCACASDAFKILVVFPFPGQSHGILGEGVVRHLLNAGHEVTYITPFVKEKAHPNLRQIDVSANKQFIPPINIKAIIDKEQNMVDMRKFFKLTLETFNATFHNENVQKMMGDPTLSFDVVIVEWMFTELYSGFAAAYNCPYIWLSTTEPHSSILGLVDEDLNPAYNPGILSQDIPPFTFAQRVKELFTSVVSRLVKDFYFSKLEAETYEATFGQVMRKKGMSVPSFEDVRHNASVVLGNSHVSLGQATRLPQNYKPIGGYHINTDIKPLPEDLQNLLDNAKHGVIYFSLGSALKSKGLPSQLKTGLLEMFGSLKQTVLWKFEEALPGLPSNVHIIQWAPQPAILAHPNCILFITHGGLLSSTEAIYFGKPTIGVPVFADQFLNVDRAVRKGFSKRVDLGYNMADDMRVAIKDVLGDPSYAIKAKELSFIYHHRPTPPGTELVHWVEHVIKTSGAPHLRSPALRTPTHQKMYLDLAAVILALLFLIRLAIKILFKSNSRKAKTE